MASFFKKKIKQPEDQEPQQSDAAAGVDIQGQPSPKSDADSGVKGERVARNKSAIKKAARKQDLENKKAVKKQAAEQKKTARREEAAKKKAERQQKIAMKKAARQEKKAAKGKRGRSSAKESETSAGATAIAPGAAEAATAVVDSQGKPPKKGIFKKKGASAPKPKGAGKPRKKKGAFGGSKFSAVGLDIGGSSMAAVRLQHQSSGSVLLSAALDQLPEGIIREGEVQDVDALGQALKLFWKSHRIRGKKVALGLASQKVVVRTLDFPLMDSKELRMAIEFQAQDYIPIPIEEAVFDFHIMGTFTGDDGIERQKVLVVAAQKAMVTDFIEAFKKARLAIDGIDLQAFALLRSFSPRSFLDEGASNAQSVAIVNIASDVTNLIIEANGEPQFTRITVFGGDNFTRAVQDQLGVPFEEAEMLKAQIGLPVPSNESDDRHPGPSDEGLPLINGGEPTDEEPAGGGLPPQGGDFLEGPAAGMPDSGDRNPPGQGAGEEGFSGGETEAQEQPPEQQPPAPSPREAAWPEGVNEEDAERERIQTIQRALEITADSFADELRRTLEYYSSQEDSLPIGRLLLSGGGSLLPNLAAHLSSMFSFEVEIGDPLVRIARNKSNLTDDDLKALAPRLAIAIGLALEDED
jgi:type IV pilus assembly protein PilM